MPAQARHAAPPSRPRAAILPGVLLAAAGIAFGGLAMFPASAADIAPRVTAASALQPVELPAPKPAAPANVALGKALVLGLAEANKPRPARASRDRNASPAPEGEPAVAQRLFVRPGMGRLTSSYGRRWGRLHAGIDLASGMGSPISAAAAGVVQSAGRESGYGYVVRIIHGDGTVTVYAHMSAITVNDGERVSAGEQVGREGNTGRSTGPHLHFEVRINGTPVNPISWLRKRGVAV